MLFQPSRSKFNRRNPPLAQSSQTQGIMPLRQPFTVLVPHQLAMKKSRRRPAKRPVQQKLARRAHQQVFTPYHLGDLHRRIVHHTGQLIRRHIIMPPDHKIAKILARNIGLLAKVFIVERNRFTVRNTEPPAILPSFNVRQLILPAGSGINDFVIGRMRRVDCRLNVLAGAGAGINKISSPEPLQGGAIKIHPFTLMVRPEAAPDIRPFTPLKAKPAQVFHHGRDKFRTAARTIQVFIAQDQPAASRLCTFLRHPKCSRMAEM